MLKKIQRQYNDTNLSNSIKVFNDGVCTVYQANERKLTSNKGNYYFSNETIGINHFYQAKVNAVGIDRAIGIPMNDNINSNDIILIGTDYYKIVQLQYKDDKKPNWWKITLERSAFNYVDESLSI